MSRTMKRSFMWSLFAIFGALATLGMITSAYVNQGTPGPRNRAWPFVLCDTAGNCVGTETTGTAGVYRLLTSTSGGGPGGTDSVSVTSGTINSATISQLPAVSVTSGTIGQITMPALTFTSGTVGNTVTVTGTVQANAGSGTYVTDDVAATNTGSGVPAQGQPIGGRASTSTVSAVTDGQNVYIQLDKHGRQMIGFAPPDLWTTTRLGITNATTTQAAFAAAGAGIRYVVTGWCVNNSSGTLATTARLLTNTTGTIDELSFTQTATTAGEPRSQCRMFPFPGFATADNGSVQAQITATAASTTVGVTIFGYKTNT